MQSQPLNNQLRPLLCAQHRTSVSFPQNWTRNWHASALRLHCSRTSARLLANATESLWPRPAFAVFAVSQPLTRPHVCQSARSTRSCLVFCSTHKPAAQHRPAAAVSYRQASCCLAPALPTPTRAVVGTADRLHFASGPPIERPEPSTLPAATARSLTKSCGLSARLTTDCPSFLHHCTGAVHACPLHRTVQSSPVVPGQPSVGTCSKPLQP